MTTPSAAGDQQVAIQALETTTQQTALQSRRNRSRQRDHAAPPVNGSPERSPLPWDGRGINGEDNGESEEGRATVPAESGLEEPQDWGDGEGFLILDLGSLISPSIPGRGE